MRVRNPGLIDQVASRTAGDVVVELSFVTTRTACVVQADPGGLALVIEDRGEGARCVA